MTKVPSPDQRIVLSCKCGFDTPMMTQAELDQFGTPWYCPTCQRTITSFKIGRPEELGSRWVVFVNRPYYPFVEDEYDTEAEAVAAAEQIVADKTDADGKYESKVYVAQIGRVLEMKTHY